MTSPATTLSLLEELHELSLPLMWSLRRSAVRAFEPLGLSPVRALLIELVAGGIAHPKELAEVMDTVPPAISAMVADLEQKGLIERAVDPDDRRRVLLSLTAAGAKLRAELRARWLVAESERLAALDEHDLRELVRIQRKLVPQ